MNISPIQTPKPHSSIKKQSFTSNIREVKNFYGEVVNRNTTLFFRPDFDWDSFGEYLVNKFKNVAKPKIYCYACSDGSEPYTLAMTLISKLGKDKAQKFFPITAIDKDQEMISQAQKGIAYMANMDFHRIKTYTGQPAKHFFEIGYEINDIHGLGVYNAKPKEILQDSVIFKKADILQDIKNVEGENSVVLIRNMWPYLNDKEQRKLASDVGEILKPSSTLVIGAWDAFKSNAKKFLIDNNFKEVASWCFEKKSSKNPNRCMSDPKFWQSQVIKK